MSINALRNFRDYLDAALSTTMDWDEDGNLFLAPHNKWPNQYRTEFSRAGDPVGHDLFTGIPSPTIAHHILISRAFAEPEVRRLSMSQQTTAPLPYEEGGWQLEGPVIDGMFDPGEGAREPQPRIEITNILQRGLPAGPYRFAFGLATRDRKETTLTASVLVNLAANEIPKLILPDFLASAFAAGAYFLTVYGTAPNSNADLSTMARQRMLPIKDILGIPTYDLKGPWRPGAAPPPHNRAGVGLPPRPSNQRDVFMAPSNGNLRAGTWTAHPTLKNDRGPGLPGPGARPINVKGDLVRPPADAFSRVASSRASFAGNPALASVPDKDAGDPRLARPSGKRAGEEYMGEQLDFGEGQLLRMINETREARGLRFLIVSQVLNRIAYARALGDETPLAEMVEAEGYGDVRAAEEKVAAATPHEAARRAELAYTSGGEGDEAWMGVGIAREADGEWIVVVSEHIYDPDYLPADGVGTCETFVVEHVEEDGSTYAREIPPGEVGAAVYTGWDLVQNGRLNFTNNSRYTETVQRASSQLDAFSGLECKPTGGQMVVSDGSLPSGVIGRCTSDGNIIFSVYLFDQATFNCRWSVGIHEFCHAAGLGHVEGVASVMQPSVDLDSESNPDTLTSYDRSELGRKYGTAGGGGGGGGGTGGGTGGGGISPNKDWDPFDVFNPDWDPFTDGPIGGFEPGGGGGGEPELPEDGGDEPEEDPEGGGPGTEPEPPTDPQEPPPPPPPPPYPGFYKRKRCIRLRRPPIAARLGLDWTYRLRHEHPPDLSPDGTGEEGGQTWYRAYPRRSRFGSAEWFGPEVEWIEVHGYPPEEEPRGLHTGLVQEDPPTEDLSLLAPPDPTAEPEPPVPSGMAAPAQTTYLGAAQGERADGTRNVPSGPVPFTLTTVGGVAQTAIFFPQRNSNQLRNAEFGNRDGAGKPVAWTIENEDGVNRRITVGRGDLTMSNTGGFTTAQTLRVISRPMPLRQGGLMHVSGFLRVSSYLSGFARVAIRCLDAEDAQVGSDLVVAQLSSGETLPFAKLYHAPGATVPAGLVSSGEFPEGTASIQLVATGAGSDPNNYTYTVGDLQVVPFASPIRRVMQGGPEEPDNFDVRPGTPTRQRSFAACGPAPTPPGASAPSPAVPALEVVDFAGGVWPAGWTQTLSGGTTSSVAALGASLAGPFGEAGAQHWILQNLSQTGGGAGYRRKLFPTDPRLALRTLMYVQALPTVGSIYGWAIVATDGVTVLAMLRLTSTGQLYVCYEEGPISLPTYKEVLVMSGIASGATLDVEIRVSGVSSGAGQIQVSAALNGATRAVVKVIEGLMWTGRKAEAVLPGVTSESEPRTRWTIRQRNIVVSRNGDVARRENTAPVVPSSYTPPPPDAPRAGDNAYRLYEPKGARISQDYFVILPGEGRVSIPYLERPISVKPGSRYTVAIFSSWQEFGVTDAAPGLLVWLEGQGKQRRLAGRVHGADGMAGRRGWHPEPVVAGGSARSDDNCSFVVPEGYHRAVVELVLTPGVYCFQEPLFTEGDFADVIASGSDPSVDRFFHRDQRRGYGRATSGEAVAVLAAPPPGAVWGPAGALGSLWSGFGVTTSEDEGVLPAGNSLTATYASGDHKDYLSPETDIRSRVEKHKNYLRVRMAFSGDGENTITVPSGGCHLRTWSPVGVMLTPDGEHFPGGALVGNGLFDSAYPETEYERLWGHVVATELTEDIRRIRNLLILVTNEGAIRAIEKLASGRRPLRLDVPTAGNRPEGMEFHVRLGEQPKFELREGVAPVVYAGRRRMVAVATVEEAEVVDVRPLYGPLRAGRRVGA